jgi:hypothetical protein
LSRLVVLLPLKAGLQRVAALIDRGPPLDAEKARLERVAEEVRSSVPPSVDEYISFAPSPGPGDSEGGDLYPPEGTVRLGT